MNENWTSKRARTRAREHELTLFELAILRHRAFFARLAAGLRAFCLNGIAYIAVCLSLFASSTTAQELFASGTPAIVPGKSALDFTIEVTDDTIVDGLQLNFEVFSYLVNTMDIIVTSPSGTNVRVLDNACRHMAISFGQRGWAKTAVGDGSDIVAGGETAASYSLADDGIPDLDGVCTALRNSNVSSNPGSWEQLPSGTYQPSNAMSAFDGEQAKGTWTIRFREFFDGLTYLNSFPANPYYPGPTILPEVNSVSLKFSDVVTEEPDSVAAMVAAQNFMASRASRLASEDVGLRDRLINRGRGSRGENHITATGGQVNAEIAASLINGLDGNSEEQRFDVWVRGSYHKTSNPSGDVEQFIGHLGGDYLLNSDMLIGIMATHHHTDQSDATTEDQISGDGYLVGPYLVARLIDDVVFSGQLQWGESFNDIELNSNGMLYSGSFDTAMFLSQAEISGGYEFGDWLLEPSLSLSHIEDKTRGGFQLTSATGQMDVEKIRISEGRLTLGQKVSFRHFTNGYSITPSVEVGAIWQFDKPDYLDTSGSVASDYESDAFARITTGLNIVNADNFSADVAAYFEGIGASDHEAYGGSLNISFAF